MTSNVYEYQKLKVDGLEKELKDTGFRIVNRDSACISLSSRYFVYIW